LGLDRLGLLQTLGGIALGSITLFSAYDQIVLFGRTIVLQRQWGVGCIAASLAIIFIDAELASGSRLRAAKDAARVEDESARERHRAAEERERADQERERADQERNRADRERNRAAEGRKRQAEGFERLDQAAVLSARVQLEPSDLNRARLQAFITLMGQPPPADDAGA
jgi:hypothetical protein